jgi:hypothetical protein
MSMLKICKSNKHWRFVMPSVKPGANFLFKNVHRKCHFLKWLSYLLKSMHTTYLIHKKVWRISSSKNWGESHPQKTEANLILGAKVSQSNERNKQTVVIVLLCLFANMYLPQLRILLTDSLRVDTFRMRVVA